MQSLPFRALLVVTLIVSLPRVAAAEEDTGGLPRWLGVGLRAGYALPRGPTEGGPEAPYLYDLYSGLFALWLDVGYRFESDIEVALWGQLARAQIRGTCPDTEECTGSNLRLGVLGAYHFNARGTTDPWLGLGLGHERTRYRISEAEVTYAGPELSLQGGFDKHLASALWGGLFFSLSAGRYDSLDVRLGSGTGSESLRHRATHYWLTFGARLRLRDMPAR
ncbi:hypothetical protein ACLESD_19080 [Pyxidicoccus sp. 3LFB2]